MRGLVIFFFWGSIRNRNGQNDVRRILLLFFCKLKLQKIQKKYCVFYFTDSKFWQQQIRKTHLLFDKIQLSNLKLFKSFVVVFFFS